MFEITMLYKNHERLYYTTDNKELAEKVYRNTILLHPTTTIRFKVNGIVYKQFL